MQLVIGDVVGDSQHSIDAQRGDSGSITKDLEANGQSAPPCSCFDLPWQKETYRFSLLMILSNNLPIIIGQLIF